MLIALDEVVRLGIRGLKMMGRGVSDSGKKLVLEKSPGNNRKVIGGGIVIIVMETVGVDKMSVFAAKLRRLIVHHFGKVIHTAPDMFGHGVGHFVGGACQNAVKTFFHGHRFVFVDSDVRAAGFYAKYSVAGKGDDFVQCAVFGGKETGHKFGSTGRI